MSTDHQVSRDPAAMSSAAPAPPSPAPAADAEEPDSFFHTSWHSEVEPGVWSLLLVPVVACVALFVLIALIPYV